ncbi:MAG: Mrp/NBP35 family ATP-binding protein [Firmicutes bacterium]|nr:Mrp/NBP35 family ATP-binding protein [Bacillota bacterium]
MRENDVLQALAGLRVDGVEPLAAGYVQDVAIEWHGDVAYVGVHVDDLWQGAPPSEAVLTAMRERVLALPQVGAARIIPRSAERARQAQEIARRRRDRAAAPKLPQGATFFAVQSGKGGVGKSTLAVNLAAALARRAVRTAILDCDVYGFSVPALLEVGARPHVVDGRLVPPRAHGVEVMSMAFFVPDGRPVVWRGPMLGKALRQMTEETAWSAPQVMVLDLPPGTGDVALDVHAFFPRARVLVVTTPDPASARVAVRAGEMARSVGHELVGVVENLTHAVCPGCGGRLELWGRGGGDLVASALDTRVVARVPWHPPGLAPAGMARAVYDALAAELASRLPSGDEPGADTDARHGPDADDRSDAHTHPHAHVGTRDGGDGARGGAHPLEAQDERRSEGAEG